MRKRRKYRGFRCYFTKIPASSRFKAVFLKKIDCHDRDDDGEDDDDEVMMMMLVIMMLMLLITDVGTYDKYDDHDVDAVACSCRG